MHGQRRDEYKARLKDDVIAKKLAHKAQQWHTLSQTTLLLQQRHGQNTSSSREIRYDDHPQQQQQQQDEQTQDERLPAQDLEAWEGLTEKLLCVNPDPLYLWNQRRQVLTTTTMTTTTTSDLSLFWEKEQNLTQTALYRNPKAYGAWFHRKWALRYFLLGNQKVFERKDLIVNVLKMELHLCGEFLMLDERNFHCWNYRRYIVGLMMDMIACNNGDDAAVPLMDGSWSVVVETFSCPDAILPKVGAQMAVGEIPSSSSRSGSSSGKSINVSSKKDDKMIKEIKKLLTAEWDFTTEKIEQNFSNGSAFHYRSKLLPLLMTLDNVYDNGGSEQDDDNVDGVGESFVVKLQVFQKELELIRNAIFTEPDDQTSWWYFRFILSWANPANQKEDENHGITVEEFQSILYDEWTSIEELVEGEDWKCKWGLLGLHMIASELCKLGDQHGTRQEERDWKELERSYLIRLKELDPDRCCRYESMLK